MGFFSRLFKKYSNDNTVSNTPMYTQNANIPQTHELGIENSISYDNGTEKRYAEEYMDISSLRYLEEIDVYFEEAGELILTQNKASIGMIQRHLKIDFSRAARIMDQLGYAGIVGPEEGTKPRSILVTMEQFHRYIDEYGETQKADPLSDSCDGASMTSLSGLQKIDFMTGSEFEKFCALLFENNGFSNVSVTKASGDYGGDILV